MGRVTQEAVSAASPPAVEQPNLALGILRACRSRQWVKNVLVFAAPGAAGCSTSAGAIRDTAVAFVAFCLVASGTYLLNDVRDIEEDRRHPTQAAPADRCRCRPRWLVAVGRPPADRRGRSRSSFLTGTWLPVVIAAMSR